MKTELNFNNHTCKITKESGDKRFNRGYSSAESGLLYQVKQALIKQGYDVIKKRMGKDGHLVDDLQQYVRTRDCTIDNDNAFYILNNYYAIYDAGEKFNKLKVGEFIELDLIN